MRSQHDFIKNRTPERLVRALRKPDFNTNEINEPNDRGLTLLQQTVREGMLEATLALIYAGADLDRTNDEFESKNSRDNREAQKPALYFAAANEDVLLTQILIICGANPEKVIEKAEEFKESEVERFIQTLKINAEVCYGILFWQINHFSNQFDTRIVKRVLPYLQKLKNQPDEISIEIVESKGDQKATSQSKVITQTNFMLSLQQLTAFAAKKQNKKLAAELNQLIKYKFDFESEDIFRLTPPYQAALNYDYDLCNTLCGESIELRALTLAQLDWKNCHNQFDALIVNAKKEVSEKAVEISEQLKYGSNPSKPKLEPKNVLAYDKAAEGRDFIFDIWDMKDIYQIAAYAFQQKNFIALNTILCKLENHQFVLSNQVTKLKTIYLKKDKEKLRYTLKDEKTKKEISDVITLKDIPDLDGKITAPLSRDELSPFFKDILQVITRRGHTIDFHQRFLQVVLANQNYALASFWITAANIDIYDFMLKSLSTCLLQDHSFPAGFWQNLVPHLGSFRFLRRLALSHGVLNQMPPRFNDTLFENVNVFCDVEHTASLDLLDCIQNQYSVPRLMFEVADEKIISDERLTNEDQIRIHDIFLRFALAGSFDVLLPDLMLKNIMSPPLWRLVISYLEKTDRQKMTDLPFLREYVLQIEYGLGLSYEMELKEKFLALSALIDMINKRLEATNWCSERWDTSCVLLTSLFCVLSVGFGFSVHYKPIVDQLTDDDFCRLQSTINPKTNHTCASDYFWGDHQCKQFEKVRPVSILCEEICRSMEKHNSLVGALIAGTVVGGLGTPIIFLCLWGLLSHYFNKKNERFSLTQIAKTQAEFNAIFSKLRILFPTEYAENYIQTTNVAQCLDLANGLLKEIKELNPTLFAPEKKAEAKSAAFRTQSRTLSRATIFKSSIPSIDARTPLLARSRNTSIQSSYLGDEPVVTSSMSKM